MEHSLSPDFRPVISTLACKPSGLDLEQRVTPSHNPYDISDEAYKEMLVRHRKRRLIGEVRFEMCIVFYLFYYNSLLFYF